MEQASPFRLILASVEAGGTSVEEALQLGLEMGESREEYLAIHEKDRSSFFPNDSSTEEKAASAGHSSPTAGEEMRDVTVVFFGDSTVQGVTQSALLRVGRASDIALARSLKAKATIFVPQRKEDEDALRSAFPDAFYAEVVPELSTAQLSGIAWFNERYEICAQGLLQPGMPARRLGDGEPRVCRYCKKTSPDVSFGTLAHAFPEHIGNKKLVDLRECDSCNQFFGQTIEDHHARWSVDRRAVGRIRGKKGVATYFSDDKTFSIKTESGALHVQNMTGDDKVKVDAPSATVELRVKRQPYVPMAIFKCYVKMALSLAPAAEEETCAHLARWLLEDVQSAVNLPYRPLTLYKQFVAGPLPNDKITYHLLRRRDSATGCPYLIFVLQYGNYIDQIALPIPLLDVPDGKADLAMQYFPHPWRTPEHEAIYGRALLTHEDLSSAERKEGDIATVRLSGSSIKQLPSGDDSTPRSS